MIFKRCVTFFFIGAAFSAVTCVGAGEDDEEEMKAPLYKPYVWKSEKVEIDVGSGCRGLRAIRFGAVYLEHHLNETQRAAKQSHESLLPLEVCIEMDDRTGFQACNLSSKNAGNGGGSLEFSATVSLRKPQGLEPPLHIHVGTAHSYAPSEEKSPWQKCILLSPRQIYDAMKILKASSSADVKVIAYGYLYDTIVTRKTSATLVLRDVPFIRRNFAEHRTKAPEPSRISVVRRYYEKDITAIPKNGEGYELCSRDRDRFMRVIEKVYEDEGFSSPPPKEPLDGERMVNGTAFTIFWSKEGLPCRKEGCRIGLECLEDGFQCPCLESAAGVLGLE